jgi:hypothetical protein
VAYKYNGLCLQVILPFERVIDLGVLKAGTYKITQSGGKRNLGSIRIQKSKTEQPDDYLYAPISQAFLQSRALSNRVFLVGNFPVSCMKIKEVKANVQGKVLVVQPIAEIDSSVPCVEGSYTFETSKDLGAVPGGRYLLHVRSMNGKAVNNLVDIAEFQ